MTYERILIAAIADMESGKAEPYCGSPARAYDIEDIRWSREYAEPGHETGPKGILFADWNGFPSRAVDLLEQTGYSIEWEDEWSACDDCGRAVRTSPDSYHWQANAVMVGECELVCLDCLDVEGYLESIEDDPDKAVPSNIYPTEHGYLPLSECAEFENGFYPGQNDNPATILETLHNEGFRGVVFRVADVGQFDMRFECYVREPDNG